MENNFLLKLNLNAKGNSKYFDLDFLENEKKMKIQVKTLEIRKFYRKFKKFVKTYFDLNYINHYQIKVEYLELDFKEIPKIEEKIILSYSLMKCKELFNKFTKTGVKIEFIMTETQPKIIHKNPLVCNKTDNIVQIRFQIQDENTYVFLSVKKYSLQILNYLLSDYLILNPTMNFINCNDVFSGTLRYLIHNPLNVECIRLPVLDLNECHQESICNDIGSLSSIYTDLKLISFNIHLIVKEKLNNHTVVLIFENLLFIIEKILISFTSSQKIIIITFSNIDETYPLEQLFSGLQYLLGILKCNKKILIYIRCFCKLNFSDLNSNDEFLMSNVFSIGRTVNINKYFFSKIDYNLPYMLLFMKEKSKIFSKIKHKTIFNNLNKFVQSYKTVIFDKYKKKEMKDSTFIQNDIDEELLEILNKSESLDLTKTIIHNYSFNPMEI